MDDAKIVQLYWDRDPSAVDQTAMKYGNYCHAIAKNILGNYDDADECVNDTYMAAWRSMPPHRPSVLSTFLGKITRNLSFNRYKQIRAEKRGGGELPVVLDELAECVSGEDNLEQTMEYNELVETINLFLASLSSEQRIMFVRRYWYTDSIAEIAKQFGMRENTVTKNLQRSRARLRQYLWERGYEIP